MRFEVRGRSGPGRVGAPPGTCSDWVESHRAWPGNPSCGSRFASSQPGCAGQARAWRGKECFNL